jgi:polar amino acid transport system permease protein
MAMFDSEIRSQLLAVTPFLLEGFGMNILVSAVAMAVGTAMGWGLALLRISNRAGRVRFSLVLTEFSRSVPTIVFQFYLVFMLPGEVLIPLFNTSLSLPSWLKAALALAVAVIGFTSDNLTIAMKDWKAGHHRAAFLFIPSWTSYALIIVMASSTASIIGVGELLSHCNTVINATGSTRMMLPIYLYACVIFFGFCFPLTLLMKKISKVLAQRLVA